MERRAVHGNFSLRFQVQFNSEETPWCFLISSKGVCSGYDSIVKRVLKESL